MANVKRTIDDFNLIAVEKYILLFKVGNLTCLHEISWSW